MNGGVVGNFEAMQKASASLASFGSDGRRLKPPSNLIQRVF